MQPSIPHATDETPDLRFTLRGTSRSEAEVERDDLRDLLAVIRDALDIPANPRREELLSARTLLISGTLRDVLDGTPVMGIPWETDLLRRMVREGGGPDA
ncbi:hypothetical protein [Streptomyces sp. NPDC059759]|uniref:hypothetical protein n=1 Tax=Streptomyces sp. NPDC059759 TaxID=3346936 RepID=UPI0036479EEC